MTMTALSCCYNNHFGIGAEVVFYFISHINEALKYDEQGNTQKALELYHKGERHLNELQYYHIHAYKYIIQIIIFLVFDLTGCPHF